MAARCAGCTQNLLSVLAGGAALLIGMPRLLLPCPAMVAVMWHAKAFGRSAEVRL